MKKIYFLKIIFETTEKTLLYSLTFASKIVGLKHTIIIIVFIFLSGFLKAQQDTSISRQKDSFSNTKTKNISTTQSINSLIANKEVDTIKKRDTTQNAVQADSLKRADSAQNKKALFNRNYNSILATTGLPIFEKPVFMLSPDKIPDDKSELFYIIISAVFLLALARWLFPNYVQNTVGLFLQTTSVNTNAKYMAQQNSVAFILLLLVFVFCGGIYVTLVSLRFYNFHYSFWEITIASILLLCVFYFGKYIAIKFLGWVFDLQTESKIYLLFVFLVNRIAGIVLIPIILILAFSPENIAYTTFIVSVFGFVVFLIYRYVLTIKTVQPKLHAKTLQIFLYLCAVEILPIVLLYKLIVDYTKGLN